MTQSRTFSTPMMQQYIKIKEQYSDCFLFYRLGDFYELFLDDALQGAKLLGITLTKRPRGKDGEIPMAGVPYHAAENYITKLIRLGHKIAICEQMSEPNAKEIVERAVIRVITPGTVVDEKSLLAGKNNFVMSVVLEKKDLGITFVDLSTGETLGIYNSYKTVDEYQNILSKEITKFQPSECILSEEDYHNFDLLKVLQQQKNLNIFPFKQWDEYTHDFVETIQQHFKVENLRGFGLHNKKSLQKSLAAVLGYLQETQFNKIQHLRRFTVQNPDRYITLDSSTVTNLEIFQTLREGKRKGSFLEAIDTTLSPMGSRLLRQWIIQPLRNKKEIQQRHEVVTSLLKNRELRFFLRKEFNIIFDIERIIARLTVESPLPALVLNLKHSLVSALSIKEALDSEKEKDVFLQKLVTDISAEDLLIVIKLIEKFINSEARGLPGEGKVINFGVNKELDELRKIAKGGKDWITDYESQLKELTKITSLKVRSNKVFGYYIEVSRSFADKVPESFERKQTLVNAERFITPELKEYEEKVFTAEEKIDVLEKQIFEDFVEKILEYTSQIQVSAQSLAIVDCLASFAQLAETRNYVQPVMIDSGKIEIVQGRHPVIEQLLQKKQFVPNNTLIGVPERNMLLVTGPNMAGKSVYMRQVALIVLLAHLGSYVPAEKATISMIDTLFVRSGASDVISEGLSTFMVEMVEVAYILRHATQKSLVIMDEVGRGTSTYDGISIAWAVAESLIDNDHCGSTLFATHYHELQQLEKKYPEKIRNIQMLIDERDDSPLFLHTVGEGAAPHSFGVAVAKLAGVPEKVCQRAESLLDSFEEQKSTTEYDFKPRSSKNIEKLKKIKQDLKKIKIENMTPIEALEKLEYLKKRYEK